MVDSSRSSIKLFAAILTAVALVATSALPMAAGEPPPAAFVPGEILIKLKPGASPAGADSLLAAYGLPAQAAVPALDVSKVTVAPGQEMATIARLEADPRVLYAELNYTAFALETRPNDLYFNPPYSRQWGLSKIQAPAAWDITTGESDIIIAVVDSGIDLDHPDLSCAGKLVSGYNYVSPGLPPDDDHGHGSHVAGIAAACTNNTTGVAGLAWGSRLMPVKALSSTGFGTYESVANGIIYAANHGADIINLSLGGIGDSDTLSDAIDLANSRGALVVAAAGNCGSGCTINGQVYYNPIIYPAAYPGTVAVAATDSGDNWASFSEHHPYVDVAAPGISIYSTVPAGYEYDTGTSMATPFVAGLAALIWSANPGLSRDQVRTVIQANADDLGTPGKDDYFGYGRINAWRALTSQVNLQTAPDQLTFIVDDVRAPIPAQASIDVSTDSPYVITWTASISPPVSWLAIAPPGSGNISAAAADNFTVVPIRSITYGTYSTSVVVTGTTSFGLILGPETTTARITYVPELHEVRLPVIFKNWGP